MDAIRVDQTVIYFFQRQQTPERLQGAFYQARRKYLGVRLKKIFHFWKIRDCLNAWLRSAAEKDLNVVNRPSPAIMNGHLKECEQISEKFFRELDYLLSRYFYHSEVDPLIKRLTETSDYLAFRWHKELII